MRNQYNKRRTSYVNPTEQEKIVRRIYDELWNERKLEVADEVIKYPREGQDYLSTRKEPNMKVAIKTVMSVGRATIFAMGLAVMLAVVLGVATTANAAAGDPLKLGRLYTINKLTQLVGSVAGPSLRIDNDSTEFGATALRLEVEQGKPPMSVNSTTEVNSLNADQVDSLSASAFLQESSDRDDFLPSRTYTVEDRRTGPGGDGVTGRIANCDNGDIALGGGGASSEDSILLDSAPLPPGGWFANYRDVDFPSEIRAVVICADLPPVR